MSNDEKKQSRSYQLVDLAQSLCGILGGKNYIAYCTHPFALSGSFGESPDGGKTCSLRFLAWTPDGFV